MDLLDEDRSNQCALLVTKPAEQDKKVEDLRAELTEIELKLREANEMELPEEEFRVAAEAKREELNG